MRAGWTRVASRAVVVGIVAALAASAACTGLDGLAGGGDGPTTPTPRDDAGRDNPCLKDLDGDHDNCGACGTVCGGMEHCLAGKCAPGCPDHVVYVSADGNDNASGCTQAMPKRTIGAAIALIKTLAAEKHEVHVCRGQYDESVVLDYRASIRGSYECSTWKQSPGYGAPTFDGVNESLVGGAATGVPITISKVDGVTVDGFTFRAKDATSQASIAATATDSAKVTFSNVRLLGGGGAVAESPASSGLVITTGAFAEVKTSMVNGGRAKNASAGGYGSAGIYLTAKGGGMHVAGSTIDGGGGVVSSGTGSVGILALGASMPTTIESSTLNGGTGHTGFGSASYGIGYFSGAPSDLSITGSTIDAGAGGCGAQCGVTGVSSSATGKVVITGNRISGGNAKADLADYISFTGLRITDFANADVQNNFVHSGNTNAVLSSGASALELSRGGTAFVAGNTLGLGPSASGKGSVVIAAAKAGTFTNNLLFFAAPSPSGPALDLDGCAGRTYALKSNVLLAFPAGNPLLRVPFGPISGACSMASADVTMDAAELDLANAFGMATSSGNSRVIDNCNLDSRCIAVPGCNSVDGCFGAIFTTKWDPKTGGDVLGKGFMLRADAPCGITRGGSTVPSLTPTDGFGVARTDPRSVGAHESDGSCTK